jgi:integrase
LYFPKQLAEELIVYASSPLAEERRAKFKAKYNEEYPGLAPLEDDNLYLFLSDQGGCYYMASDDPRYKIQKTPAKGQMTDHLKKKILSSAPQFFPKDFSFHWLRATFAFQLYQKLIPHIKKGELKHGEEISFIQARMHHVKRETTENYLKLFRMHSDKLLAQEAYEDFLFGFTVYDDLKVRDHEK